MDFVVPQGPDSASNQSKTKQRCPLAQLPPVVHSDQLLQALRKCDDRLNQWLSKSPANACLFLEDPLAAMKAANPDMDFNVMLELEAVLNGLAQKLGLGVSACPDIALDKAS
jgi:hypothetical protein